MQVCRQPLHNHESSALESPSQDRAANDDIEGSVHSRVSSLQEPTQPRRERMQALRAEPLSNIALDGNELSASSSLAALGEGEVPGRTG